MHWVCSAGNNHVVCTSLFLQFEVNTSVYVTSHFSNKHCPDRLVLFTLRTLSLTRHVVIAFGLNTGLRIVVLLHTFMFNTCIQTISMIWFASMFQSVCETSDCEASLLYTYVWCVHRCVVHNIATYIYVKHR